MTQRKITLLLFLLIAASMGRPCHAQRHSATIESKKQNTMTDTTTNLEHNKAAIRTVLEEAFNKRRFEILEELVSDDYIGLNDVRGANGFHPPIQQLIKGFPDARWNIEEIIAEGDKVFARWIVTGTHRNTWQNIQATGKTVAANGMGIFQFKDGRIVKAQVHTDRLSFLQALGVLPADPSQYTFVAKEQSGHVRFIDKFLIPAAAKDAFYERMNVNRSFIKTLPGFIEDHAYEGTDKNGNLVLITIALWKDQEALNAAREKVQEEYKREGFDPAAFLRSMGIVMDRGIYKGS